MASNLNTSTSFWPYADVQLQEKSHDETIIKRQISQQVSTILPTFNDLYQLIIQDETIP